ncbi:MAG: HAD-IA family hydrolase [Candidatus Moraniibacteriota bacterium]
MQKIYLFDADGVVVAPREKYFSQRYAVDYGVSGDVIMPLFKNEFGDCVIGKKELSEVLKGYVGRWQWHGTIDELLEYWWAGENKRNEPVLQVIQKLRVGGALCYLATDQVKERKEYLLRRVGLEKEFDGTFFSSDLGTTKDTEAYWHKVLAALGNPDPARVSFWDDEPENVKAAKAVGIDAYLFTTLEEMEKAIM